MSKENNYEEKEDIEDKINQETTQKKNKELEKLLIDIKKKDIFKEEGLSGEAIIFSKNIEIID